MSASIEIDYGISEESSLVIKGSGSFYPSVNASLLKTQLTESILKNLVEYKIANRVLLLGSSSELRDIKSRNKITSTQRISYGFTDIYENREYVIHVQFFRQKEIEVSLPVNDIKTVSALTVVRDSSGKITRDRLRFSYSNGKLTCNKVITGTFELKQNVSMMFFDFLCYAAGGHIYLIDGQYELLDIDAYGDSDTDPTVVITFYRTNTTISGTYSATAVSTTAESVTSGSSAGASSESCGGKTATFVTDPEVAVDTDIDVEPEETFESMWSEIDFPDVRSASQTQSAVVGTAFSSTIDGTIQGVYFFRHGSDTGDHVCKIYDFNTKTELASTTRELTEDEAGRVYAPFSTPLEITADTVYVVSVYYESGKFCYSSSFTNGVNSKYLVGLYGMISFSGNVFPELLIDRTFFTDIKFSVDDTAEEVPITTEEVEVFKESSCLDTHVGYVSTARSYTAGPFDPLTLGQTVHITKHCLLVGIAVYRNSSYSADCICRLWNSSKTSVLRIANAGLTYDGLFGTSSETVGTFIARFDEPLEVNPGDEFFLAYSVDFRAYEYVYINHLYSISKAAYTKYLTTCYSFTDGETAPTLTLSPAGATILVAPVLEACEVNDAGEMEFVDDGEGRSMFLETDIPTVGIASASTLAQTYGSKLEILENGIISAVRFYKGATSIVTDVAIYSDSGTLLSAAEIVSDAVFGWVTVQLDSPVSVSDGDIIRACVYTSNGHLPATLTGISGNYFGTHCTGIYGIAGVYVYGSSLAFPSNNIGMNRHNYVDVIFDATE